MRLVAYEASDREIAVHYPDLPLKDLLPRLLKQESFVVGLRTVGSRSASLVSTLRVIGDKTGNGTYAIIPPEEREALGDAMSGAAAVRDPAPDFEIPADVLSSGFQSDSPTDHEEAARYISEDMLGDEGSRRRFVAADGEVIANQLRRYQHSANILAIVRNRQADAAVIAKLNEIIVDVRRDR